MARRFDRRTTVRLAWWALFVTLLLGRPRLARAQHRTILDYGLAAGSTALLMADWSQTLRMADNPRHWRELNPLLGPHPTEGRVNTIAGLTVVLNGSALLLPKVPRRIWYAAVTVVEMVAVAHNLSLGAAIGF
ncbi:MAG TPA: hypothetical protein VGV12_09845 [Gemmatimonadales bacterium]|nr:hypothetical protein [Gemmatimonadales bacterium]